MVGDDEGDRYAASAHMMNAVAAFTLCSQLTYYRFYMTDHTPWGTGDLIPMGVHSFGGPMVSEGMVPALSIRYSGIATVGAPWLDGVIPYVEWSTIFKTVEGFNDNTQVMVGAVWTIYGALYINLFVGRDGDD